MAFSGWPAEAVEFFIGLAADNSRTYWTEHRDVFDACVHEPMVALTGELADEFGTPKISRPYRDVRFSPDKTPYKTAIYAIFERGGYVRFSADGLTAGRGSYAMAPDQLDRYRRAVADERSGPALVAIVAKLTAQKVTVDGTANLKTAPKGYPKDHLRIDLLRHKDLIAWQDWPVGAWLGTRAAKTRVVQFLRKATPLQEWLDEHVGPSTSAERER
jgi:uncharacterized protein (TIGR02453 family)